MKWERGMGGGNSTTVDLSSQANDTNVILQELIAFQTGLSLLLILVPLAQIQIFYLTPI